MPSVRTLYRWMKADPDGLFAALPPRKFAAKPTYSRALAETVRTKLAAGEPAGAIARAPGMPNRATILHWWKTDRDGLFAGCPRRQSPRGRPTLYSKALAEEICDRLASGRSLSAIAREPGMPAAPTVVEWVKKDIDGFAAPYARARELGWHTLADEIIDIADDASGDWRAVPGGRRGRRQRGGRQLRRDSLERAKIRIAARQFLFINTRPNHERAPLTVQIVQFSDVEGEED